MKKTAIVISIIFLFMSCKNNVKENGHAQNSTDEPMPILLDSLISLAKANSYYAKKVDWSALRAEMLTVYQQNDSIDKLGKAAELMFKELGDYHGMLMYDYKVAFDHRSEESGPPNDSIYKAIGATKINAPYSVYGELLKESNVAYIEILGTGMLQGDQVLMARDEIRTMICNLKSKKPIGWIIDLRCNIGGNMNPMMAGLGELISDTNLGGDTKDGLNFNSKWKFENGNFYENGYAHFKADLKCEELINTGKIAVLTSIYTASAGEVVASSLKGQDNVKLIGQKTSGLSSTNGWFVLTEKWVFAPMTAYYMSKDKTVHYNGIIPDVKIKEELNLTNLKSGETVEEAIKWITSSK
ncbi:S41 family peptidase [Kordia jejudonensis]|uniref:S41 family peptidase n=1 Tax=Kordia jejudonensis TaxID=1348245 RepID=UPI00062993DA|nr:S41 family peptidase [Kordia jejudonensis]